MFLLYTWIITTSVYICVYMCVCVIYINHWSRKWQLIPLFLPGKFHGQKSLVGYSPWSHKKSNMTEHTCTWIDIKFYLKNFLIYVKCHFYIPWILHTTHADGDCSHEIKRHLLLIRKGKTNLDTILKSRDITLPTKSKLWFFR